MSEFKTNKEWGVIDGEPCRVKSFTPTASIKTGKIVTPKRGEPYGSIIFESKKISDQAKGFITHRLDFQHLWSAFKVRELRQNEEVIILWTKKNFKRPFSYLSVFMPKLWVMICQKGAFELMTDSNFKPELVGEARWHAQMPIKEWKPEVMK